ncbi:hypothetical protein Poli38472_010169 [Pythium oligandrum]|uniref:Ankyrin repeat protein n=1 Tax=Pythium oligandrum TaxID=41045 RepID=A0A8K1C981_PYTOL|nr:hypothetical protein Poli38472_010169 [Pythium oligandrum]|eukprot:TMW58610.1 hypothetical protein Poli38472_010169 [Pythium oligandrum]
MVQQWLSADWVLRALSPFLHEDDALRLAIYAMEMHERPLWRFLLFDDAVRPPLRFSRLMDHAMAHACWHAILELRRMDVRGVRRRQSMNQTEEHADVWRASQKYFENEGMRPTEALQAVIWRHSLQPRGIASAVLYAAASHGHLEAVLWLHCVTAYDPHKAVECAAQHGHLRVVDWLLRHHKAAKRVTARVKIRYLLRLDEENKLGHIAWNVYLPRRRSFTSYCLSSTHGLLPKKRARSLKHRYPLMDWAAAQGNLELLEEFHKDEFATVTCTTDAMDQAAEHGHLEIVQWLHEHRHEGCTSAAMTMAASQGHLDVVQWLHAYRTEGCDSGAHLGAAGNGHLEVVRWLDIYYPTTRKGYGWNDPLAQAAFGGHFDVVRYYSDFHGLELTARALADAAGSGHFEIVRWIIDRVEARVVDVDYIVSRAACSGNLELMHWLVDERGLWGFDVVRRAAMHNRVEILAYLHSVATRRASITGVAATPVANYAFDLVYLTATGCFEAVEWLLRNAADYVVPLMNMDDFQFVAAMERYYEENDDALGMLNEEKSHKRPYQWSLASNQPRDRLQSVLRRLILALPTSVCMRFPWLPLWAIQTRSFDVLKALATITHPHVFKTVHLRALVIYSGHAPIIQCKV